MKKRGRPVRDLAGQRFDGWIAVRYEKPHWLCQCDCGKERKIKPWALQHASPLSESKHCECQGRLKRGYSSSHKRAHQSWTAMRMRCNNPNHSGFPKWGGRGIRICARWDSFENFLADMGDRPAGTTLDRYPNNDGNYEPGNCRWADAFAQSNNRRNSHWITFHGETKTIAQWAREKGLRPRAVKRALSEAGK